MEAYGIIGEMKDLEDMEGEDIQEERHVIFVLATYGEGEPTDNAKEFWKWLCEDLEESNAPLKELKFGVFGLGNKTYEHYNWMSRNVNKKLEKFGAISMIPYGEGDDDATLEDDFAEWKENMWKPLCATLGVKPVVGMFDVSGTNTWKWKVEMSENVELTKGHGRFTG